jgi:hypothetical protein
MGMCGNGVWIIGIVIMQAHQLMAVLGYLIMMRLDVYDGVALGSVVRAVAVLLLVATAIPLSTATALSVFELSARYPGHCNLLPYDNPLLC